MTLSLIPRPKRLKPFTAGATRQLIVFTLRQERFALPIRVAKKVIAMGNVPGYIPDFNTNLMLLQDQEVSIIHAEQQIFRHSPSQKLLSSGHLNHDSQVDETISHYYLLVVQNPHGEIMGFPIATQPTLQLVPESAFAPLPANYLHESDLRCVSAVIRIDPDEPPIFLLNLHQLVPSYAPPEVARLNYCVGQNA